MGEENRETLLNPKDVLRIKTESGPDDVHYSVFYEELPEEFKRVAEQTLKETRANKEKGLRELREFVKKENLSCTDDVLITMLRSHKYDIKKAKSKLQRFLKFRLSIMEKVCRVDDRKIGLILRDTPFSILPYRDKHGRAVLTTRATVQLDQYSMDDAIAVGFCLLLYILNFPMTTVSGLAYIADGQSDSFLKLCTILNSLRSYLFYFFDIPLRYGKVDVVNENLIIRIFMSSIRRILPLKLAKRFSFHGEAYENLKCSYHPDILPKEFGGNLEPISDEFYRDRLMDFIRTLKEEGRKLNFPVVDINQEYTMS